MEKNEKSQDTVAGKKESIPQLFGRNVRKYRKARNLTQEQLSEKLEISQKHLSIIETGTQFASASLIGRISEVLEVSPGDLFGGSSDGFQEIKNLCNIIMSMLMNEMRHKFASLDSEVHEIKRILQEGKNPDGDPFSFY
ncbi:MAG: helix-turn-helix transcriptional regulator [Treponema sp.]|jgi:transcriptional regulator with XRE-family HTH domain|uniref:helix-turn-helix domain-containing protein n=1 Tax=Treponema sp. TaxID=166 RepID=UPI0025D8285C|nr:helix-turn-helix transcriptional regulator [Treponema sp.]MBQ8678209.1 helix-turn-helix transcriptional regulator [Treponema sp.]